MDLKKRTKEWIDRYLGKGNSLVRYKCPLCGANCHSVILEKGQVHDTLTVCPECEKLHFKIACDDKIETSVNGSEPKVSETVVVNKDNF